MNENGKQAEPVALYPCGFQQLLTLVQSHAAYLAKAIQEDEIVSSAMVESKSYLIGYAVDMARLLAKQPLYTHPAQPVQPDFSDAYQGAREDAEIWKKRALEAEELNRKFIADINGPTFMGEPAQPVQPAGAQEPRYWVHNFGDEDGGEEFFDHPTGSDCPDCVPLYLVPPAAQINQQLMEALEKITEVNEDTPVKTYQEMERIAKAAIAAAKGVKNATD